MKRPTGAVIVAGALVLTGGLIAASAQSGGDDDKGAGTGTNNRYEGPRTKGSVAPAPSPKASYSTDRDPNAPRSDLASPNPNLGPDSPGPYPTANRQTPTR